VIFLFKNLVQWRIFPFLDCSAKIMRRSILQFLFSLLPRSISLPHFSMRVRFREYPQISVTGSPLLFGFGLLFFFGSFSPKIFASSLLIKCVSPAGRECVKMGKLAPDFPSRFDFTFFPWRYSTFFVPAVLSSPSGLVFKRRPFVLQRGLIMYFSLFHLASGCSRLSSLFFCKLFLQSV